MDYDKIKATILAGSPHAEDPCTPEAREASGTAMIELLVDMAKNLDIIARSSVPIMVRGFRG